MEIEEISKLKAEQKALRSQANRLETDILRLEDQKKSVTAGKKARILEDGLSRDVLERLNDLESKDPDIAELKAEIEKLKAKKQACAEREFKIATEIAKILE